jgi:hypothetical protein
MLPPIPRDMQIVDEYGRSRQITPRQYYDMTGRINARPQNPRYMGGSVSDFTLLQDRRIPAFQDPRRPGMSVRELSEDAARLGFQIPRASQAGMTADEIRQANVAASMRSGNFEKIRREFNQRNSDKRMNRFGDIIPRGKKTDGTPAVPKKDGTLADVAGVDLEKLRPDFSAAKPAPIVETSAPVTAAQRRQMLADVETGRMEKRTDGRISEVQSKYGKGTSRILKPGEARPVAMTTDEFGKPETMKSFLERRRAIQQSKGMT